MSRRQALFPNLRAGRRWSPWAAASLAASLSALVALPAHAQYKVIGPDGKVTYTDRAPTSAQGRATPLAAKNSSGAVAADAALPAELRQVASRYPVTLYSVTGACELCSAARQLLRQRGIPYAEKQIMSPEDSEALERLSGGRDIPTLTIGPQTLRGLASEVWMSYLDAAGYPRDSKLPPNYQFATPTPIVERTTAPAPAARAAAAASAPATTSPEPSPSNPAGIKF